MNKKLVSTTINEVYIEKDCYGLPQGALLIARKRINIHVSDIWNQAHGVYSDGECKMKAITEGKGFEYLKALSMVAQKMGIIFLFYIRRGETNLSVVSPDFIEALDDRDLLVDNF